MNRLNFLLVATLIGLQGIVNAQDVRFSHYSSLMPALNPAATGAFAGDFRLIGDYRISQYSAADPFTTIYASYDQGLKKYKDDGETKSSFFAAGLSFLSDKAGIGELKSQEVSLMLSYNIGVATFHYLTVGVKAGYGTRSVNYSDFMWALQYDPSNGSYNPAIQGDPLLDESSSVNYTPLSICETPAEEGVNAM